ncbi:MAG: preprotein translocase subunit YajC [Actinomycetes bacterium]
MSAFLTPAVHVLAATKQQSSPFGLLILLLPMAAILWVTVMPQRKQRQRQAELMSKLAVGDEVVMNSGIMGTVTFIEDDVVHVEVDTDVVVRVAKAAIGRRVADQTPAASGDGSEDSD